MNDSCLNGATRISDMVLSTQALMDWVMEVSDLVDALETENAALKDEVNALGIIVSDLQSCYRREAA